MKDTRQIQGKGSCQELLMRARNSTKIEKEFQKHPRKPSQKEFLVEENIRCPLSCKDTL